MISERVYKNGTCVDEDTTKDLLDIEKFNSLPSPVMARLCGGATFWPIETLCVQTGLIRLDIHGQIDLSEFALVAAIKDSCGNAYDTDDF